LVVSKKIYTFAIVMKKLSFIFLLSFILVACSKEKITPGSYTQGQPQPEDTTSWQSLYEDAGVLPSWGNVNQTNELVGTTWVLTHLQIGLTTQPLPIDTVRFINNIHYTINSGAVRTYQLSVGVATSSKSLTLNYHFPFGSGNYKGEVASTFVSDGVIYNCEFYNTNTSTMMVRASFVKI
jgi:hypothetical protein